MEMQDKQEDGLLSFYIVPHPVLGHYYCYNPGLLPPLHGGYSLSLISTLHSHMPSLNMIQKFHGLGLDKPSKIQLLKTQSYTLGTVSFFLRCATFPLLQKSSLASMTHAIFFKYPCRYLIATLESRSEVSYKT